jgi:hypothetical protein
MPTITTCENGYEENVSAHGTTRALLLPSFVASIYDEKSRRMEATADMIAGQKGIRSDEAQSLYHQSNVWHHAARYMREME